MEYQILTKYISDDIFSALHQRIPKQYYTNSKLFLHALVLFKAFDKYKLFKKFAKQSTNEYKTAKTLYKQTNISQHTQTLATTLKAMGNSHLLDYIKYFETKETINQEPTTTVSTKYLSDGFKLNTKKNYLIKADTGTGKTTLIMDYIKTVKYTVIIVAPIRSFLFSLSRELKLKNIEHSLYVEKQGYYKDNQSPVILCSINSIKKISKLDFSKVIFIGDEFNSVIKYLFSSPIITDENNKLNRGETVEIFTKVMAQCKQLIAMDADLNQICIDFVKKFKSFDYIYSEYKVNQGKNAIEYNTYKKLLNAIKSADDTDGKFMICCDEAKSSEQLYNDLVEIGIKDIKLFVSDKMTDDDKRNFNLDNHKKVIFSPVCVYGVDSVMERQVFCLYGTYTIDPLMFYQQINRCRKITQLGFHFKRNKKCQLLCDNYTDFKKAYANENVIKTNKYNSEIFNIINDMNDKRLDEYSEFFYRYLHQDEIYKVNKKLNFLNILEGKGFKVCVDIQLGEKTIKMKKAPKDFNIDEATIENYNKYLNIPNDKIEQFKEYFDKQKFINYLHFKKFYNHSSEELESSFKDNSDFTYALLKTKLMAIIVAKRLIKQVKADTEYLLPQTKLTEEQVKKYTEEINASFRLKKYKLDTVESIQTTLINMVRYICPDMITRYKKVQGKVYYKVDTDYVVKSNLLSSFSSQTVDETVGYEQKKVYEEPDFIDEDEDPTEEENKHIEELEINKHFTVHFD